MGFVMEIETAQKMKFSVKEFFSKCDQIRRKLRIWSHLLKNFLMENFIVCAVKTIKKTHGYNQWSHLTYITQHSPIVNKRDKSKPKYFHSINFIFKSLSSASFYYIISQFYYYCIMYHCFLILNLP